ncbi:hypothetical protein P5673_026002 [Acropora cervicornis]|uniref:Uncharacterized protein n=1 Tax=Acropora cervicornis TaxID=6130 RepID=A0AAD9Q1I3_ACRCE|nr:hypothetical protein P5673_026002 [Acropora cervicornis]
MENFPKQDNTDLHFMRYDFTGNLREPLARLDQHQRDPIQSAIENGAHLKGLPSPENVRVSHYPCTLAIANGDAALQTHQVVRAKTCIQPG